MTFQLPEPLQDLGLRITREYRELPGLQLTIAQASRLFNTDPTTVEAALERLVASSFLSHAGAFYVRAELGRHGALKPAAHPGTVAA